MISERSPLLGDYVKIEETFALTESLDRSVEVFSLRFFANDPQQALTSIVLELNVHQPPIVIKVEPGTRTLPPLKLGSLLKRAGERFVSFLVVDPTLRRTLTKDCFRTGDLLLVRGRPIKTESVSIKGGGMGGGRSTPRADLIADSIHWLKPSDMTGRESCNSKVSGAPLRQ